MERTTHGERNTYGIDPDVYDRRWWTLAVLCTSLMVVIIGNTALNVALPTLARDLHASLTAQQWMVDGYALVFAGMLFTGGAIGDRRGRKGALQIGLLVFMTGSVFAAVSHSAGAVIAGRAIMGLGGAFVMPATLSILMNVFPAHERTKAIAVWAGIAGSAAAIGPIMSGFLLEHFWWGSVFLVNVPIISLALIGGHLFVPTSRDPDQRPLDVAGALLSIAGVGALVYAIIEAPNHGWASAQTALGFVVAAVLLCGFVSWERHTPEPMLDMRYFADRRFSIGSASMAFVYFAMFGTMFLVTQYFQLVLGYGTLAAGVRGLPFAVMMMAVAPNTPRIAARIGANRMVSAGLALLGLGILWLTQFQAGTSYLLVGPVLAVIAFGMALTMSPLTASIMSSVPPARAGVGSAMNDTSRELGGALGVAVLGSLVASRFDQRIGPAIVGLSPAQHDQARASLAGALQVARGLEGTARDQLTVRAEDAFLSGFHLSAFVAASVAFVASAVVWRLLPLRRESRLPLVALDEEIVAPIG